MIGNKWIKVQQVLYNLDEFSTIHEPVFMNGTASTPGYWQISFTRLNNTMFEHWSFSSEVDCKATYRQLINILTPTTKLF